MINEGIQTFQIDSKLIWGYVSLGGLYERLSEFEKSIDAYNTTWKFFEDQGDIAGMLRVGGWIKGAYAIEGNWPKMFNQRKREQELLAMIPENAAAESDFLAGWGLAFAWAGRYFEVESDLKKSMKIATSTGFFDLGGRYRDCGFAIGMQDRFEEADTFMSKDLAIQRSAYGRLSEAMTLGLWGAVCLRNGRLDIAVDKLEASLRIKESIGAPRELQDVHVWLGQLFEVLKQYNKAESHFTKALQYRSARRLYFESGALAGLARVKHMHDDYTAVSSLLTEAEQLVQQYEYNDHLTSLRLTQGHVVWDGHLPEWGAGFDTALRYYQHALIYALRYNRFLLDETLSGRPQGTPLWPIIPHCLKRGEEGRRMLIALRDWWKAGVNDIGAPRPDTISPIPEGIPLLEAERIARDREPGDGSAQKTVAEQLDATLTDWPTN